MQGYAVKYLPQGPFQKRKVSHLLSLKNLLSILEIVQATFENKSELSDFLRDCEIVITEETPFFNLGTLEKDLSERNLFDPTLSGTEKLFSWRQF